jgi:hypothetical protein
VRGNLNGKPENILMYTKVCRGLILSTVHHYMHIRYASLIAIELLNLANTLPICL